MPARKGPLEQSQKKLYNAVRKELALYEPKKKRALVAYERAFRSSLPRRARASDRPRLFRALKDASVVLVGDFHPFRQSQKGFLRLVEGAAPGLSRGGAVALECFQQAHQAAINEFLAGLITADELRDKIDFERYWPFSWESYREILLHSRRNHLAVLALNITGRRGKDSDLRARDEAAAERIARHLREHPGACVFTLYGELHLGRDHLPAELRTRLGKKNAVLTVHQNDTELYWKAPALSDGQKPEVLQLGPREFCILNSVPWVKLRSYLDWLEGSPAPEMEDEELDVVGVVHHYARLLADAVGIPTAIDDATEILPPDRLGPRGLPSGFRNLRSPDRELADHALAFHHTGYLPVRAALLLPAVSTNALAEAAAHLLRHSLRAGSKNPGRWTGDDWICHFMVGYLGSKILNPKRKCNEVGDLRRRAEGPAGTRRDIAARALTLLRPLARDAAMAPRRARLTGARELEACRTAGFVLGDRFFLALLANPELLGSLGRLLRGHVASKALRETKNVIGRLRISKREKSERF